jgi:glucose dehydrogenase
MMRRAFVALLAAVASVAALHAQSVSFQRIQQPEKEPQNWLSYSQNLFNQRFSPLTQITPANAKNLELQWVWQSKSLEKFEATALVVDGVLYTLQGPPQQGV